MLAPPKLVELVFRVACMVDVNVSLPFRVQFFDGQSSHWLDFSFIDQLEIVSRMFCRVSITDTRFILFGIKGLNFKIQATDEGKLRLSVINDDGDRHSVRIVGSGDFFHACRLSFADGVVYP